MANLENAIKTAVLAHFGQQDKAGAPYILHPLRMMMRFDDPKLQMAAILHDVVEDTDVSLEDLKSEAYPQEVIDAVIALTRRGDETYKEFIARAKADPIARQVKKVDIEDNMDMRRIKNPTDKDFSRMRRYRKSWESLR